MPKEAAIYLGNPPRQCFSIRISLKVAIGMKVYLDHYRQVLWDHSKIANKNQIFLRVTLMFWRLSAEDPFQMSSKFGEDAMDV